MRTELVNLLNNLQKAGGVLKPHDGSRDQLYKELSEKGLVTIVDTEEAGILLVKITPYGSELLAEFNS